MMAKQKHVHDFYKTLEQYDLSSGATVVLEPKECSFEWDVEGVYVAQKPGVDRVLFIPIHALKKQVDFEPQNHLDKEIQIVFYHHNTMYSFEARTIAQGKIAIKSVSPKAISCYMAEPKSKPQPVVQERRFSPGPGNDGSLASIKAPLRICIWSPTVSGMRRYQPGETIIANPLFPVERVRIDGQGAQQVLFAALKEEHGKEGGAVNLMVQYTNPKRSLNVPASVLEQLALDHLRNELAVSRRHYYSSVRQIGRSIPKGVDAEKTPRYLIVSLPDIAFFHPREFASAYKAAGSIKVNRLAKFYVAKTIENSTLYFAYEYHTPTTEDKVHKFRCLGYCHDKSLPISVLDVSMSGMQFELDREALEIVLHESLDLQLYAGLFNEHDWLRNKLYTSNPETLHDRLGNLIGSLVGVTVQPDLKDEYYMVAGQSLLPRNVVPVMFYLAEVRAMTRKLHSRTLAVRLKFRYVLVSGNPFSGEDGSQGDLPLLFKYIGSNTDHPMRKLVTAAQNYYARLESAAKYVEEDFVPKNFVPGARERGKAPRRPYVRIDREEEVIGAGRSGLFPSADEAAAFSHQSMADRDQVFDGWELSEQRVGQRQPVSIAAAQPPPVQSPPDPPPVAAPIEQEKVPEQLSIYGTPVKTGWGAIAKGLIRKDTHFAVVKDGPVHNFFKQVWRHLTSW